MAEEYIKLEELRKRYDIPHSTWFYAAKDIPKKGSGYYLKSEALELCNRCFTLRVIPPMFDWIQTSDLGPLYTLEQEVYGDGNIGDPNLLGRLLKRNPYLAMGAFSSENRKEVWGVARFVPVEISTVLRMLEIGGVKTVTERGEECILSYEKPGAYELYVASILLKKDKSYLFQDMMLSYLNFWVEQYPRIWIDRIWARAVSPEGQRVAREFRMNRLIYIDGDELRESSDGFFLNPSVDKSHRIIRNFREKLQLRPKS